MTRKATNVGRPTERTSAAGEPVNNKILLAIPENEFRIIRPHLEFLNLPQRRSLHEPNQPLVYVVFLNRGLLSLVVETEDGKGVEVGMIGKEGVLGIGPWVGLSRSPLLWVVQIAGTGFRVKVSTLQRVLQLTPKLQKLLDRYAVLQWLEVTQIAACNRLHNVEQRLALWLLMAADRVDSGVLAITHDFLAIMLGTDRPSVSLAASILQRKKVIEYRRGMVKILNRKKLEDCACECHRVIRQSNAEIGQR
jgi:CRP-like cAMP-binding protein